MNTTKPLLLDGPMGTELIHLTGKSDVNSFLSNNENPELISQIHQDYISSGSEVLFTNSFACLFAENQNLNPNIYKNCLLKSIRLSKSAALNKAQVGFSMGPCGAPLKSPLPDKTTYVRKLEYIFDLVLREEIDFIIFETQYHFEEIKTTLEIARASCPIPLWLSLTINDQGNPLFLDTHPDWLQRIEDFGVDILGFNCGTGPESIVRAVKKWGVQTELPLLAKPSKGLPNQNGNYLLSDDEFIKTILPLKKFNLYAIGGCCGTTHQTIKSIKKSYT